MKSYNTIEKYKRSEYLKEYSEIISVYESQMKPLKNPFLIAFIAVFTIIGTVVFANIVIYILHHKYYGILIFSHWSISDRISDISSSAFVCYFIPNAYFIRRRQVIRHKDRRLENLEEKKMQAVSAGIYDANA